MTEITRLLQKYIRSRYFGGPLKVGAPLPMAPMAPIDDTALTGIL